MQIGQNELQCLFYIFIFKLLAEMAYVNACQVGQWSAYVGQYPWPT